MLTRTGGSWAHEYTCLSTDTKPTYANSGKEIPNGSICFEMDSGNIYFYDVDSDDWLMPQS